MASSALTRLFKILSGAVNPLPAHRESLDSDLGGKLAADSWGAQKMA